MIFRDAQAPIVALHRLADFVNRYASILIDAGNFYNIELVAHCRRRAR
jgi:hypothetical protein